MRPTRPVPARFLRIGIVLFVVAVVLITFLSRLPAALLAPGADGSALSGSAAPAFTLPDQRGAPVSLSDFQGKVVVLSFLYALCPDICPITATNVNQARALLSPADQARTVALAVSVDPVGDTAGNRASFADAHGGLIFVGGDEDELRPVWSAYTIDVRRQESGNRYTVDHRAVTYLIGPDGRLRRLFRDEAIEPDRLALAITTLLQESP